ADWSPARARSSRSTDDSAAVFGSPGAISCRCERPHHTCVRYLGRHRFRESRATNMKTFRFALALASFLVIATGGIRVAANTFYPATVTFSDRAGDSITSDYLTTGKHTYVNGGTDKLECGFWVLPNNDLVLRAPAGGTSKLPRFLAFSLTP